MLRKYFGNRAFYARVLIIAVPIMIQSGITNFVNLLDNIMVGSLGEEALSGVAIVNQYTFVYNLMIFGAISAAGIFTAQYHGFGDTKGVRNTFRFKLIINVIASVVGIAVFFLLDDLLISLFLQGRSPPDAEIRQGIPLCYAVWTPPACNFTGLCLHDA